MVKVTSTIIKNKIKKLIKVIEKQLNIRNASVDDTTDIFEWRNDPLSISMSISNEEIIFQEHEKWFHESLINRNRELFIGVLGNQKVGICRFDYDVIDQMSEVSINLNPLQRGKGLATKLLLKSIVKYRENNNINLTATIKKTNIASMKIFQKCNFHEMSSNSDCFFLLNKGNKV